MMFFSMRFWTEEAIILVISLVVALGLHFVGLEGFFKSWPLFLGSLLIVLRMIVVETRDKTVGLVCVFLLMILGLGGTIN